MTHYILSPAARADLDEIWEYSEENWGAEQAERYVFAIRAACDALATGKLKGRSVEGVRANFRKQTVGSHLLFYKVAGGGVIDVIRVLHQRMDFPSRLDH